MNKQMHCKPQKWFVSSNTKISHSHKRTGMITCILHTEYSSKVTGCYLNPFPFLSCFCLLRWRLPPLNPPLITAPIQTFLLKDLKKTCWSCKSSLECKMYTKKISALWDKVFVSYISMSYTTICIHMLQLHNISYIGSVLTYNLHGTVYFYELSCLIKSIRTNS